MDARLAPELLARFNGFLTAEIGLYFPRERWGELESRMATASRELGFDDTESAICSLLDSPPSRDRIEVLASHLTVGETYFLREPQAFAALEQQILPKLMHARRQERHLRIWSAGCATGEEPYSIAMFLRAKLPQLEDWNLLILGTDINVRALQHAAEGVYREWSFRGTPAWVKERFFRVEHEGQYRIHPEIRKMVTFAYLNLAEDAYPSLVNNTNGMDLISCRNVLMYFAPEAAHKVADRFHHALAPGGWLLVGACEVSSVRSRPFATFYFPGATLFRKIEPSHRRLSAEGEGMMPAAVPKEPDMAAPRMAPTAAPPPSQAAAEPQAEPGTLLEQGQYQAAAEQLRKRLRVDPEDAKSMALLARAYGNQGRLTEAQHWCEQALSRDRTNPAFQFLYASILQENRQLQQAAEALERVLYLQPDFVLAHFALGNLALQRQGSDEAERQFRLALRLLDRIEPATLLPESDGMTAGRLRQMIRSMLQARVTA